ncbi:MAG TPA: pilus assembly protein N-terminal domain-containing protein [Candidatus Binatia bacterium]|nr:pilus assembly protein N-terminal domain-containing protein [Candidatus Binatia bacterium]
MTRSRVNRMLALAAGLLAGAVALGGPAAPAGAQTLTRLYLSKDKSQVLDLRQPAATVAVANPAIADVQVISPTRLLVIGRSVGVTSLVTFSDAAVGHYDVVVHPAPMVEVAAQPLQGAPHGVLVQRADKLTEHFFTRDTTQQWVELGSVKVEPDAGKK